MDERASSIMEKGEKHPKNMDCDSCGFPKLRLELWASVSGPG
mgnify:CR=1 FL=1